MAVIPTNIDRSSNFCNSGSRRATEDPKKRKSLEFDAEDDEDIKSGPAVNVWSHEGFILTSKIAKNCLIRL